jgi:pyruvate dehydrogenase E1 component beta subunit
MYFDFVTVAFDQLLSNAAKSRYMFGGQTRVPLTLFARSGAGTGHAAQHSESFYSMLAHIPGLKVVVPSDPYSVKGLLAAAIRDDDPVFLVNDKKLINLTGFVPDEDYIIELGKGRYLRRGTDVTLVGMSYTSIACQKAADQLAEIGIDAEVIDMMSLSPFDEDILIESVSKTNNVVIVDEDTPRASMASEFAAIIADKAFDSLDSPVKRVTSPHAPVPYNRDLENAFMPQPEDVVGTVKNLLGRE